jgi:hypothetical protein
MILVDCGSMFPGDTAAWTRDPGHVLSGNRPAPAGNRHHHGSRRYIAAPCLTREIVCVRSSAPGWPSPSQPQVRRAWPARTSNGQPGDTIKLGCITGASPCQHSSPSNGPAITTPAGVSSTRGTSDRLTTVRRDPDLPRFAIRKKAYCACERQHQRRAPGYTFRILWGTLRAIFRTRRPPRDRATFASKHSQDSQICDCASATKKNLLPGAEAW